MKSAERLDLDGVFDASGISRFQFVIIILCGFVAMIDGFDTQSIALVAPEIASNWHVDPAVFGPVFGAGLLGGLLGAMIFGAAGDRFGRKPTLMFAIMMFGVITLITPFTDSVRGLILIRFLTGAGLGGALPSIISITSEYAPKRRRATIVGLMFCGFPLGAVVGSIAAARFIPLFGWKSVFIAGGAIPLILLPLFWILIPESARFLATKNRIAAIEQILKRMQIAGMWDGHVAPAQAETRSSIVSLFTEGRAVGTILLWITLFLSLLLTYFLINWLPIVARQTGIGIEGAVLTVAALNLGAITGCVTLGQLVDRRGPFGTIAVAFVCGAVAIVLIGQAGQSSVLLLATAVVAGFFSIGGQMCAISLCAGFYETSLRATGIGWAMGVGRIGGIVGPVIGGMLISMGMPAPTLFAITGIMSLGAAASVLTMGYFAPGTRRTKAIEAPFVNAANPQRRT